MNKQLEFQFNQAAKKIVDNNYKDSKNKPAFTQMAENARDLLGYKYNSTTYLKRNIKKIKDRNKNCGIK